MKHQVDKSVCSKITLLRILPIEEVKQICNLVSNTGLHNSGNRNSGYRNSGNCNSGYRNSGNCNSGYRNSGNWNSGYRNSGYRNSGDWNSGDWNSGFFNSTTPKVINVFNKKCKIEDWEKAPKPKFIFFENTWQDSLNKVTKRDIELLKALPNFDKKVFEEISGLTMKELHKAAKENEKGLEVRRLT